MRSIILYLFTICCLLSSCSKTIVEKKDWRYFSDDINIDRFRSANEALGPPAVGEKRVVFMGNSITEAWPVHSPGFFSSGEYIARGVSGQTSPQMLLRFKTDVVALQPQAVVILAGTNDIAQNTGYTPNEIVLENIEAMAEIASYHKIKVILASVLPASDFPWKPGLNPAAKIKDLNQMIQGYAEQEGFLYVDYYSALVDDSGGLKVPDYTSADDLVHPNQAGYAVMETLIEEAIEQALSASDAEGLSLNSIFSDHMVLQRNDEVALWGTADPAEEVTISASWGAVTTASADQDGEWKGKLKTPQAGGPYSIEISTATKSTAIEDILIGEVWLASGQSNMQMPLKGWPPVDIIQNSQREIDAAKHPHIRMYTAQMAYSIKPLDNLNGSWKPCTPQTAGDFSATAYFFAKRLQEYLDVPIGIIHSSWGGTVAEAWTSQEKLRTLGDFDESLDILNQPEKRKQIENWYKQWPTSDIPDSEEAWSNLDLQDDSYTNSIYADQSWTKISLPGRFDVYEGMEFDGAFWFRKSFDLKDTDQDYSLEVGAIDDMDQTYINGVLVGSMVGSGKYNLKRSYPIPAGVLKRGKNVISIKAIDTGGPGAFSGAIGLMNGGELSVDLTGEWRYIPAAEFADGKLYQYGDDDIDFSSRPALINVNQNTPSTLFNAMIHPLIPYTMRGAVWYQGESNVGRAIQYERLFPAMISDWRERWGRDFPFYFVQIAPYKYNGSEDVSDDLSQALRDAQRRSLALDHTGMVVTMDIGDYNNIHPANKHDVGSRLAGLALAHDYDAELTASGPLYSSHRKEGRQLILSFDEIGSGLQSTASRLEGFEIAGADFAFVPASARIEGNEVVVYSTKVSAPRYVRYGWSDRGATSLKNQEGLPASSFTTGPLK